MWPTGVGYPITRAMLGTPPIACLVLPCMLGTDNFFPFCNLTLLLIFTP